MATINLGRIKPVFRGAYAGGTAYVVDDIVTHGNESFICIQAGTGNATSNASYWTKLAAKGADGADGTNVATTLTTQGDILYRDGSGLARLGYGTAGQVLQTGGSGANPSWGTVSSDWVKLSAINSTSTTSSHSFTQFIDDSVYRMYQIVGRIKLNGGSNTTIRARFLDNTTERSGSNDYWHAGYNAYRRTDNSSPAIGASTDGDGRDYMQMLGWDTTSGYYFGFTFTIFEGASTNHSQKHWGSESWGQDNSSPKYRFWDAYRGEYVGGSTYDGIKFYTSNNSFTDFRATLYGVKK